MTSLGNKNNENHLRHKCKMIQNDDTLSRQFFWPMEIWTQKKWHFFQAIFVEKYQNENMKKKLIFFQAIFDATNTTRERRATVYERIVHQHGLKCMFLESICNRWDLIYFLFWDCKKWSIFAVNVLFVLIKKCMSLTLQFSWQAVQSVAKVGNRGNCQSQTRLGSDFPEIALLRRWQQQCVYCCNQFREMGTWFIWHFYGRTTLNMLWWTITPQNGKDARGTVLSVWTINMDQPEKKTTFA